MPQQGKQSEAKDREPPVHEPSVHESTYYSDDMPLHEDGFDWTPPTLLNPPAPRPGMVQRWVRAEVRNQVDAKNLNRRMREGWRPRDPRTVRADETDAPTENHRTFGSCIMVEGMVLCEMPAQRNKQRQAYYQQRLNAQTRAVDEQLMKVAAPGHPIDREAKTVVTVNRSQRRPRVQEDEEAA